MAQKGRESHIHNLLSQGQNWTYHCVALWRPISNPFHGLKAAGQWNWNLSTRSIRWLPLLCLPLSTCQRCVACHPASQAAIAQPPPLPYQDNELHYMNWLWGLSLLLSGGLVPMMDRGNVILVRVVVQELQRTGGGRNKKILWLSSSTIVLLQDIG